MTQTVFSVPWKSETFEVLPLNIVYQEEAVFKDTYAGDVGWIALDVRKSSFLVGVAVDRCLPITRRRPSHQL